MQIKKTILLDLFSDDIYNEARGKLTVTDAYNINFGKAPKIINIEKASS